MNHKTQKLQGKNCESFIRQGLTEAATGGWNISCRRKAFPTCTNCIIWHANEGIHAVKLEMHITDMIPLCCSDEQAQLRLLPYAIMNDRVIHTWVPKELHWGNHS